ncbi:hypothetical protein PRVXT_002972 [Proteinivorax tanatarense]|uniref:Uncharacterized protein n=1 Tax=Proteinivorax tanatarense TaxID=1260629 RepID=A0AAU7VM25_9FIRM
MRTNFINLPISFIILLGIGELFQYFYKTISPIVANVEKIIFTILLFLFVKVIYDFLVKLKYNQRLFLYIEDYMIQIVQTIAIAILAIFISGIIQYFVDGTVRMTILASAGVLYLKNS